MLSLSWLYREDDAAALIATADGRAYRYPEVQQTSRCVAAVLADFGQLAPGDRVAILSRNQPAVFEILLACARLQATLVPLNWRLSSRELAAIVRDCAPRALFYDREHLRTAAELAASRDIELVIALDDSQGPHMAYQQVRAYRGGSSALAASRLETLPEPDSAAMLLYTSGTTGAPKGVVLSWRQIASNAWATGALCQLSPRDRTLVFLPLFHTGGLNCLATPILAAGGAVVVMPEFDAEAALDAMAEYDITAIIGVPTIYEMLLAAGIGERALPHLRWLLMGGAPPAPALFDAYRDIGHPLNQGYGLTEVGPNCFTIGIDAPIGSVGAPVPGTEAGLRSDSGQFIAGPGTGELCLRGPHVTSGYWNNPDATAAVLSKDGWFATGDIARRDQQGWFYIVGRKKDMFISGGENVYPAEVERVLREHPEIVEAAVIGVSDETWGEVGLAVVSLRPDDASPAASQEESQEESLRESDGPGTCEDDDERAAQVLRPWLRERLAAYKVPKRWRVVAELPKTPTGKIAKAVLVEQFA